MTATTLRVRRRMRAPAAAVFAAWVDPRVAGRWLFATATRPLAVADIDARVRGRFRLVDRRRGGDVEYRGVYTSIEPHRALAFTLDDAGATTSVTVAVEPATRGCDVVVVHRGVPRARAAHTRGRWAGMLYGLAALLESSLDPVLPSRSFR